MDVLDDRCPLRLHIMLILTEEERAMTSASIAREIMNDYQDGVFSCDTLDLDRIRNRVRNEIIRMVHIGRIYLMGTDYEGVKLWALSDEVKKELHLDIGF
jgi:DNA invertase Pin-like site-specific DNA recombinase